MKKSRNNILLLTTFIAVFIYLMLAFNNKIWLDEGYTLSMIRHNMKEIWSITSNDVHPPLYYWGLRLWSLIFGFTIISAKVFSIIPFLLLLIMSNTLIKKEFGIKTSLIFNLLCSSCSFWLEYSIQIRMYSWAIFFCTVSGLYAYKVYKENSIKSWSFLLIYSLLSMYTHFYSLLTVFVIFFVLLILILLKNRSLLKNMIITSSLISILFIPWLIELLKQISVVSESYWIPEISIKYLLYLPVGLFNFTGSNHFLSKIVALINVMIIMYILIRIIRNKEKKEIDYVCILSLSVFIGVVLISIIASLMIKPILHYRYLTIPFGMIWIFLSIQISKISNENIIKIFLGISILMIIPNYSYRFINIYKSNYEKCINAIKNITDEQDYILYSNFTPLGDVLPNLSDRNNIYLNKGNISPYDTFAENIYDMKNVNLNKCDLYYLTYDNVDIPSSITDTYKLSNMNIDEFNNGRGVMVLYKLNEK